MSLSKDDVREALRQLRLPGGDQDVTTTGDLLWVTSCDGAAAIKLNAPVQASRDDLQECAGLAFACVRRAAAHLDVPLTMFTCEFVDHAGVVTHRATFGGAAPAVTTSAPAAAPASDGHRPIPGLAPTPKREQSAALPGVAHIIAVGAGKGGVGKSTVAVNLAVGLARRGKSVGILDGDIYGPSLPTLLDLGPLEVATLGGKLVPFLVHGIKAMTIGKLTDPGKPLIWRGPMAHGAFKQLAEQTGWGELDYLIIDLPPGTGDVALTMAQILRLSGAVVVCTPQKVAQDDAERAARMFQQLGIDVLGIVENMSFFIGDDGKEYDIFGRGGAQMMAQRMGLPFLGAVPINMALRRNSDEGNPIANFEPGTLATSLDRMIDAIEGQIALSLLRQGGSRPTLKIT